MKVAATGRMTARPGLLKVAHLRAPTGGGAIRRIGERDTCLKAHDLGDPVR